MQKSSTFCVLDISAMDSEWAHFRLDTADGVRPRTLLVVRFA